MDTLKDLLFQLAEIESTLSTSGGELSPELEGYLETLHKNYITKVDQYAFILDRLESNAAFWKVQEAEVKARREALEAAVEKFRDRIKETMLTNNIKILEGNEVRITISPTKGKVILTNDKSALDLYGEQVVTTKIKLDKIREDLENGIDLKVAKIEQTYSMKIKKSKGVK